MNHAIMKTGLLMQSLICGVLLFAIGTAGQADEINSGYEIYMEY